MTTDSNIYDDETGPGSAAEPPKPDTLAILTQIIAIWRDHHQGQHDSLHAHNQEAAKQWIHIQEKPQRREAPTIRKKPNGSQFWETPYLHRITQLLCKFLTHGDEEKAYIVAAGEAGIPWRGDDIESFRRIVEEAELMSEIGKSKYRARVKAKLNNYISHD